MRSTGKNLVRTGQQILERWGERAFLSWFQSLSNEQKATLFEEMSAYMDDEAGLVVRLIGKLLRRR